MSRKPSFFNPRPQDNWSGWSRLLALNEQPDPLELSWQVCRWLVITRLQLAKQTIACYQRCDRPTLNCSNLERIIANGEEKCLLLLPFLLLPCKIIIFLYKSFDIYILRLGMFRDTEYGRKESFRTESWIVRKSRTTIFNAFKQISPVYFLSRVRDLIEPSDLKECVRPWFMRRIRVRK